MAIIVGPYTAPVIPTTATSVDGIVTVTVDLAHGGVLLRADYSAATPQPYQVRFLRDGVPVRSGDPSWAPGGYALAYDYEMPLGVASVWTAVPIYRTAAGGFSTGIESAGAAVTSPDGDEDLAIWIKSIPNPNLSMRIATLADPPELGQTGRNSLTPVPQSPVYSGSWDISVTAPRTFGLRTEGLEERDRFLTLLNSGPVLVQSLRLFGIYDFYALATDVSENYLGRADDPWRGLTVTFVPITRPPTIGAPLYLPGHSYDDVDLAYVDYDQLTSAVATYLLLAAP